MLPCRRFADVLADARARLGADVGRYSFIEVDLHHILLAGLPAHSLTLRPAHSRRHLYVTCYTEGFSHFVTSMTAPVASGWSVRRVGLAPTGKRRLLTAQAKSGRSRTAAFILTTPAEVDRWLEAKRPLDGRASRTSRVRYRRLSNRADRAPSSKPSPVSSQRMAPTISARLAHLQSLGAINPSKKAPSSS
jgi:hypothetical protein